jgi:hypothetical protein
MPGLKTRPTYVGSKDPATYVGSEDPAYARLSVNASIDVVSRAAA